MSPDMPLLDAVLGWIAMVSGLSGFVAWPIFLRIPHEREQRFQVIVNADSTGT